MIPEYTPPAPYGDHQRGTWDFRHRQKISKTLKTRHHVTAAEAERREFRRVFIEEPRRRERAHYVATGEYKVGG